MSVKPVSYTHLSCFRVRLIIYTQQMCYARAGLIIRRFIAKQATYFIKSVTYTGEKVG